MPFASDGPFTISQVDSNLWKLIGGFSYYDSRHIDRCISVPSGFVCDGSSIPRVVWPIIGHPLEGPHGQIGFLHDYLYQDRKVKRKIADLIYLEAHKDLGTPFWKRQICYRALRMFGWIPY